ncbi:UDP-galactopyranose mutase [uncultured Draconibacterium sp.]|uniref:UDP-galactopyranose mutase n=1 Tax=uncultured Draconibacterium sp. TaxID=1573823 RepID=UPI002AA6AFA2|nr:UDP-galactopyranose mutase [uncultured Draconibacterium sp.]
MPKNTFDFLIVGAGLFGSVFAAEMKKRGKKCLVIDKRKHVAGNVYTEKREDINVHVYGAHIFHTSNKRVWDYVNNLVEFNRYTNSPVANYKGRLYNLPFNMNTFYQLWGVSNPEQAKQKIEEQREAYKHIKKPKNLEEQALVLGGKDIYERLIKGYTEKQWGRPATQIPAFIIRRLPFRFTFDNNYFKELYQGIPIGGYTKFVEKLLEGVEVRTEVNFFEDKTNLLALADKVVFTGKIDEYFDYQYGKLEYRSLHFEHEVLETDNFQGNAVVNYTDREIPFTRILEHKHFEFGQQKRTIITREYPHEYSKDNESYYPINDEKNQSIYEKYLKLSEKNKNIIFGGRLAEYKYYDMHQVIEKALDKAQQIISEN